MIGKRRPGKRRPKTEDPDEEKNEDPHLKSKYKTRDNRLVVLFLTCNLKKGFLNSRKYIKNNTTSLFIYFLFYILVLTEGLRFPDPENEDYSVIQ